MSVRPAARRIEILGVPVDLVGVESLQREILRMCRRRRESERARADGATGGADGGCEPVLNVNAHCINLACRSPRLRRTLSEASLVFCDGFGVTLAARLLGLPAPERITYADWMWSLAGFSAREGLEVYLLGAEPGVAGEAARRLRRRYPALRIAGEDHGYFDKSPGSAENEAVLDRIADTSPDILIVCFGMPAQELWISENRHRLDCGVALAGGAALDYVSGRTRRGPGLLTGNGLEWLARLVIEPRRLWRRYVIGNPAFIARVVAYGMLQRRSLQKESPIPEDRRGS